MSIAHDLILNSKLITKLIHMRYSLEDATQMLREDFIRNSYVLHDLLGNAGFAIKLKHFVYAYISEGKMRSECSTDLRTILEEKGVTKSGITDVLGLLLDIYKNEPMLNK